MRITFLAVFFLTGPALLAQSSAPTAAHPSLPVPSHRSSVQLVSPQSTTFSMQNFGPLTLPQRSPLLAQNNIFSFTRPAPQSPIAKVEPIPTQWPIAKFEGIPTHWNNVQVVPIGNAGEPTSGSLKIQR
jgi:hypothetical protein